MKLLCNFLFYILILCALSPAFGTDHEGTADRLLKYSKNSTHYKTENAKLGTTIDNTVRDYYQSLADQGVIEGIEKTWSGDDIKKVGSGKNKGRFKGFRIDANTEVWFDQHVPGTAGKKGSYNVDMIWWSKKDGIWHGVGLDHHPSAPKGVSKFGTDFTQDHFVKKLFALDDMKEYLLEKGHKVQVDMDMDQPFYRDLGNEFKSEIGKIRHKRAFDHKYAKELDELLSMHEESIEQAKKNFAAEVETEKSSNKRPTKSPKKIKSIGKVSKIIPKGIGGASATVAIVSAFLTAEKVMAASKKFDRAYISGPQGVQELFEKGEFQRARNKWMDQVVGLRNDPANELLTALNEIDAKQGGGYLMAWEHFMPAGYEDMERIARAEFLEHVDRLKSNPAVFKYLPEDADLKISTKQTPKIRVLSGEAISLKVNLIVNHNLGDYGYYEQPVYGAPIKFIWKGQQRDIRVVKTDTKGNLTAKNFIAGIRVRDTSLGSDDDRTKWIAGHHELEISLPEWNLSEIYEVLAYDYIVVRNDPNHENRAQANGQESIYFSFKLQRRLANSDGSYLFEAPNRYQVDLDSIGVSTGIKGAGPLLVSQTKDNYKSNIEIAPKIDSGDFEIYAVSESPGLNEIRLDIRGDKFSTRYTEVGKYPVEFTTHPINFFLEWDEAMADYIKDNKVVITKANENEYPLKITARKTSTKEPAADVKLIMKVLPENHVQIAHASAITDKEGKALKPVIWQIKPGKSTISISAEGSANKLIAEINRPKTTADFSINISAPKIIKIPEFAQIKGSVFSDDLLNPRYHYTLVFPTNTETIIDYPDSKPYYDNLNEVSQTINLTNDGQFNFRIKTHIKTGHKLDVEFRIWDKEKMELIKKRKVELTFFTELNSSTGTIESSKTTSASFLLIRKVTRRERISLFVFLDYKVIQQIG